MPAIWPTFITQVGNYLNDAKEGKTHEETAEKIASSYHTAVSTAQVILYPNLVIVRPPYLPIKNAILKTFNNIRESEKKARPEQFTDWANAVVDYWKKSQFSPLPFHPQSIIESTGTAGVPIPITHMVTNGGDVNKLKKDLHKVFDHEPQKIKYGIPFATELSTAFISHLQTVKGEHKLTVIPGTPASPGPPIVAKPFKWSGVV